MQENTFFKKIGAERIKLFSVLLFFLLSGILYSHSFYAGELDMGEPAAAAEITEEQSSEVSAESTAGKCNINTATAEELMRLSGIGEKKAADILRYREENGGFSDIADIMKVSGIGEKNFAAIQAELTVEE